MADKDNLAAKTKQVSDKEGDSAEQSSIDSEEKSDDRAADGESDEDEDEEIEKSRVRNDEATASRNGVADENSKK